jgi:hypothetical protein
VWLVVSAPAGARAALGALLGAGLLGALLRAGFLGALLGAGLLGATAATTTLAIALVSPERAALHTRRPTYTMRCIVN